MSNMNLDEVREELYEACEGTCDNCVYLNEGHECDCHGEHLNCFHDHNIIL